MVIIIIGVYVIILLLLFILCILVDSNQLLKGIKRDVAECERILYREERRQQYKK